MTAEVWRTRRAAVVAGILFGVLLLTAMTMMRVAQGDTGHESWRSDAERTDEHQGRGTVPDASLVGRPGS
jgi:hypothetical protein